MTPSSDHILFMKSKFILALALIFVAAPAYSDNSGAKIIKTIALDAVTSLNIKLSEAVNAASKNPQSPYSSDMQTETFEITAARNGIESKLDVFDDEIATGSAYGFDPMHICATTLTSSKVYCLYSFRSNLYVVSAITKGANQFDKAKKALLGTSSESAKFYQTESGTIGINVVSGKTVVDGKRIDKIVAHYEENASGDFIKK